MLLCDRVVHRLSAQNYSFLIASLRRFGWAAALLLLRPLHVSLHRFPAEALSSRWTSGRRLPQQSGIPSVSSQSLRFWPRSVSLESASVCQKLHFRLMPIVTGVLASAADYYCRRCLRGSFVSATSLCHALGCANPWTVPLSFRTSAVYSILKIPDVVSNTFLTLPNSDLLAATSRSVCRCCPSSPMLGFCQPYPR